MISEHTQHIAVLTFCLHLPSAQSLKDKRMVLKSLKDKIRAQFNVSVCEMDGQDKWQVATFDVAMIGNDRRHMDACLNNILSLVESYRAVELTEQRIEYL